MEPLKKLVRRWYHRRVDEKGGDIRYELHELSQGDDPIDDGRLAFISFQGVSARGDCEAYVKLLRDRGDEVV